MTIIGVIKNLAASTAVAGFLGLAAIGIGSGLAHAATSTDAGSGSTSSSTNIHSHATGSHRARAAELPGIREGDFRDSLHMNFDGN